MVLETKIKQQVLRDILSEVKLFTEKLWDKNNILLLGFTDHGYTHSLRILLRISEILGNRIDELTEEETFVLLVSAYLHDIGMQDWGLIEELFPDKDWTVGLDWNERGILRKKHAERVREILSMIEPCVRIKRERIRKDLPKLGFYKRFVAEISYGHSTVGFKEICMYEPEACPSGEKFRFGLIAALLLLGDEFDLDHSRALHIDDSGIKGIDPISLLHTLKHRYIKNCSILSHPDKPMHRIVEISYHWPKGSEDIRYNYQYWIQTKLIEQINLVHFILKKELGIEFDQNELFKTQEPYDGSKVEQIPSEIHPFLLAERARIDKANLEPELNKLSQNIKNINVCCLLEPMFPGEQGAREIMTILVAKILEHGMYDKNEKYSIIEIDPDNEFSCTDPKAICDLISNIDNEDIDKKFDEGYLSLKTLKDNIVKSVQETGSKIVIILNAHLLPYQAKKFISNGLIPLAFELNNQLKVLISASSLNEIFLKEGQEKICISELSALDTDEIKFYLRRHTIHEELLINQLLEKKSQDKTFFSQNDAREFAEWFNPN